MPVKPAVDKSCAVSNISPNSGTTSERHHGYDSEDHHRDDQSFHLLHPTPHTLLSSISILVLSSTKSKPLSSQVRQPHLLLSESPLPASRSPCLFESARGKLRAVLTRGDLITSSGKNPRRSPLNVLLYFNIETVKGGTTNE